MTLRLAFYADDFTGATDALESLTLAGARAALFIDPPTPEEVERLGPLDAVGVAGESRTWSPRAMRRRLPAAFAALRELGAPLCHYKVCSTFDSAPDVGNLAVAGEIGMDVLGGSRVPIVPGAPALGRWCVFGTLFARDGEGLVRRLDRHPVARHPVTPMREAGVLEHLARLTDAPAALVPSHLAGAGPQPADATFVVYDVADERDLEAAARAVDVAARRGDARMVIGASGIGGALAARWGSAAAAPRGFAGSARTVVLSGSCSAITAAQIRAAAADGWPVHALDTRAVLAGDGAAATEEAGARLAGADASVVHSALGPEDARVQPVDGADATRLIGEALGDIAEHAIEALGATRLVVTGGDNSGAVARALGIRAVEMLGTTVRGAPMCRAHAPGRVADGVEVVFKGGSLGGRDYFEATRTGSF